MKYKSSKLSFSAPQLVLVKKKVEIIERGKFIFSINNKFVNF